MIAVEMGDITWEYYMAALKHTEEISYLLSSDEVENPAVGNRHSFFIQSQRPPNDSTPPVAGR